MRLLVKRMVWIALPFALIAYETYVFITGGLTSSFEEKVQNQIHSDMNNGSDRVSLEKIKDINWTNICMVAPYVSKDKIAETTNKLSNGIVEGIAWTSHDGFWTLLFIDDKQVVPVRIPRVELGDYSLDGHSIKCVSKVSGLLKIERKLDGKLIRISFTLESTQK